MEFKALEKLIGQAPTTAEVNAFNHIELNNSLIYVQEKLFNSEVWFTAILCFWTS